jgi:hypothetical protein
MITYENANNETEWPDALNAMSAGANLSWALDPNFAAVHTEIAWVSGRGQTAATTQTNSCPRLRRPRTVVLVKNQQQLSS